MKLTSKEEQLVFLDRPADGEAGNLAHIGRLIGIGDERSGGILGREKRKRIHRAPGVVAIIEVRLPVKGVGAALGNGVDDAAGRAAVLGGVVGGIDLKFLDGGFGAGIAGAGSAAFLREESLVIVGAIHGVVVEQHAHAAEADEDEAASVVHDGGREQYEIRPAAAIDGQIADGGVVQNRSEVSRSGVDLRGLGADGDGLGGIADIQAGREVSDSADVDDHLLSFVGREAGGRNGDGIHRRFEASGAEVSG